MSILADLMSFYVFFLHPLTPPAMNVLACFVFFFVFFLSCYLEKGRSFLVFCSVQHT